MCFAPIEIELFFVLSHSNQRRATILVSICLIVKFLGLVSSTY